MIPGTFLIRNGEEKNKQTGCRNIRWDSSDNTLIMKEYLVFPFPGGRAGRSSFLKRGIVILLFPDIFVSCLLESCGFPV